MAFRANLKKIPLAAAVASLFILASASQVAAHVTVKPGEAGTAAYQVFTVNVPNEKEIPTVAVKVLVPEGVTSVTPTNKAGWDIAVERDGAAARSITWSGGEITDSFRDEFTFSAKTPDAPAELQWKAYQTYADGTVVAWDQDAEDGHGHGAADQGPFSVTNVADDLEDATSASLDAAKASADRGMYFGVAGLVAGLVAVYFATRKK